MKKLIIGLAVSVLASVTGLPAFSQDVPAETKEVKESKGSKFSLASLNVNRAASKNSFVVTGGFDANYFGGDLYTKQDTKGDDIQPWGFQFNPSAEYFVTNGLAIGGTFIYGYTGTGADNSVRIAFGPKASLYWNSIKDMIPFFSLELLVDNKMIYKDADKSNHWDYTGYSIVSSIGDIFMVSNQVGFYGAINFTTDIRRAETEAADGEDQTESLSGWTMGAQFGVKYFIF